MKDLAKPGRLTDFKTVEKSGVFSNEDNVKKKFVL